MLFFIVSRFRNFIALPHILIVYLHLVFRILEHSDFTKPHPVTQNLRVNVVFRIFSENSKYCFSFSIPFESRFSSQHFKNSLRNSLFAISCIKACQIEFSRVSSLQVFRKELCQCPNSQLNIIPILIIINVVQIFFLTKGCFKVLIIIPNISDIAKVSTAYIDSKTHF